MAKLAKSKSEGNVTVVDLGEEVGKSLNRRIDRKLKAAGVVGKEKMAGPMSSYRSGGYRPGMFGYRPWYADKQGHAMGASYAEKMRGLSRPNLMQLGIGGLIGALGNRALVRVTPDVVKTDSALAHNAIAFVVGLVPVLAKPNSYTLGVAIPGAAVLMLSLFDYAMDYVGIKKPALRGPVAGAPRASIDAAVAARQKLADVHNRMNHPVPASSARVTAQAVS